jgi:hypothetical protein
MNPEFYAIWKRPIWKGPISPLLYYFHFGVPEEWDHRLHFSNFDSSRNGESVNYSKNVFTMPAIMGRFSLVLSADQFSAIQPLVICRYRKVCFTKTFLLPWEISDSIDLFQEYLALQTRRCELEGIPDDQIEFAFGRELEDAYKYYQNQNAVEFSPASDYYELIVKFSSESFWAYRDHKAALPKDLMIVGPTTTFGTDFSKLRLSSYHESAVEPKHRSQIFLSFTELKEYGILKAGVDQYFCRPDVFATLKPHLDTELWCVQGICSAHNSCD